MKISRDKADEICKLYQEGKSLRWLADNFNIGEYAIRTMITGKGISLRKKSAPDPEKYARREVKMLTEADIEEDFKTRLYK